jgi:ArsR family transcriptional regulator
VELRILKELREYHLALGDAARLRIVEFLARREQTVTEIARGLRMSQPLVSWHLRRLVRAGLVQVHREGREVHCSLNRTRLREYERTLDALIAE